MEETIVYGLHLPAKSDRTDYLSEKLDEYLAFVQSRTHEFIWNREEFNLSLSACPLGQLEFLSGSTNYGDNVDDEWFVIYLLYELSRLDQELAITLEDFDGQMLLIEAANHIPKWLDPNKSENRVFIYQGNMHIIPKTIKLDADSRSMSKKIAIEYMRNNPDETLADCLVQEAINSKINRFPDFQKTQLHRAKCYLPISIAKVLESNPQLVSSAVDAFYERDPYEARSLRTMKRFPPQDRIMRTVTFTRNLYAKIIHNVYLPDKRSGWKLPPKNAPEFKAHDLGLKLACGFEIIMASANDDLTDDDHIDEIASFDFESDSKWQKYKKNLDGYGYFRDELEGSKLYKELLDRAKESYYNSFIKKNCQQSQLTPSTKSTRSKIAALIDLSENDRQRLQEEEALPNNLIDDDDSWLNVTAEQLDRLLEECFSTTTNRKTVGPQDVTKLMRNFVSRKRPMGQLDNDNMFDRSDSSSHSSEYGDEDDYDQEDDFDDVDDFDDECSSDTDLDEHSGDDERLDGKIEEMISDLKRLGQDMKDVPIAEPSGGSLKIRDYMKLMDKELESTNVNVKDFMPVNSGFAPKAELDSDDYTDEEAEDAKMDSAICHNLLEAYNAGLEANQPGAACNMLQSMRLLPSQAMMKEVEKDS